MVSFQPPSFRISFCCFRLRPPRSRFRKWAFPRQFTKSLRSKGIMIINHERNPRKTARSWGCSSVVERVLRMYEAPGSTPGSSICVILSRSFASFFFFSFFNVVQWIPFNITPFLLQGPWCHPTRAFTEGKKEGREEKKKEEKKKRNHPHRHLLCQKHQVCSRIN